MDDRAYASPQIAAGDENPPGTIYATFVPAATHRAKLRYFKQLWPIGQVLGLLSCKESRHLFSATAN
jgi:hypothetical protein